MDIQGKVAIIGGGPAGLATARALRAEGLDCVIFERYRDFGGLWDAENPGSPIYESAHFISSRTMSGHEAFPMPEDYPDYPSARQILAYARSFARAYGLYDLAEFGTEVSALRQIEGGWELELSAGGETRREGFAWVVAASGTNWHPHRPRLEGEEFFTGKIIHSQKYRSAEMLKGQRVLVVGAGNSGVDIACDAAFAAEEAHISLRRGYHFIPKHIFGQPADVFGSKNSWMPLWLSQFTFGALLRLLTGDLTRLGLPKPDHKIFETHPIMNSQILHYLQHGDLTARPDIDRLEGQEAIFADGSRAEIDLIIMATGYDWRIPYLPEGLYEWEMDRAKAFLKIFNPGAPSIFLNGFVETNSGAYKLFDEIAMLIAKSVAAQRAGGADLARWRAFIEGPEPEMGGGVNYVKTPRHAGYVNVDAYRRALARMRDALDWGEPKSYFAKAPKGGRPAA